MIMVKNIVVNAPVSVRLVLIVILVIVALQYFYSHLFVYLEEEDSFLLVKT